MEETPDRMFSQSTQFFSLQFYGLLLSFQGQHRGYIDPAVRNFPVDCLDLHIHNEVRTIQRPKLCHDNNKDEDNIPLDQRGYGLLGSGLQVGFRRQTLIILANVKSLFLY